VRSFKCALEPIIDFLWLDNPTPKFGDALRQQVEERLAFFETGAPPAKNADAIRAVLDQLALEEGSDDEAMDEDEPHLPLLENTPPPVKEKKKKRKANAMDVDEDEEPSEKKVKLSKEEKKALKKAKKAEHKAAAGDEVSSLFC
jgi:nucleolar protein 56